MRDSNPLSVSSGVTDRPGSPTPAPTHRGRDGARPPYDAYSVVKNLRPAPSHTRVVQLWSCWRGRRDLNSRGTVLETVRHNRRSTPGLAWALSWSAASGWPLAAPRSGLASCPGPHGPALRSHDRPGLEGVVPRRCANRERFGAIQFGIPGRGHGTKHTAVPATPSTDLSTGAVTRRGGVVVVR